MTDKEKMLKDLADEFDDELDIVLNQKGIIYKKDSTKLLKKLMKKKGFKI